MKNLWNKFKGSRVAYALLAFLSAVFLWLYVDVTTEPDTHSTIRGIPVTFLEEDKLEERGLMIVSGKDTTVTLELTGVRAVISQIDRDNISITVDADSQITGPGTWKLDYTITPPPNISLSSFRIQSRSTYSISVNVVEMKTKTIPVQGIFTGNVAGGYLYNLADFALDVSEVTVSGEGTLVDQVDRAQVVLSETELSETWTGVLPILLVDSEGNVLDTADLTVSAAETEATFPVRSMKKVPLKVSFLPGGGATEADVTYTLSQEELVISGTREALETIESVNLGTVDLSQVITSEVKEFPVVLPDGIVNEGNVDTVTVNVSISGLLTRKLTTKDIRLINVPEGMDAVLSTTSLEVRIRGRESTMELLTEDDVYVEADLSGVEQTATGSCTLPVTVKVAGMSDIGAIDSYSVVVELQPKQD